MKERIQRLRRATLEAVPRISMERARLVTEFHRGPEAAREAVPVRRAMCFRHIMANKALYVGDDELIVGERGPAPAAVPTYPEICVHSLQDLERLDGREKVSYKVDAESRRIHETEILPFWQGQAQRDRMFAELPREWIDAYDAGMFTEFQEQRTPGHTVLGDLIYRKGFLDLKLDIRAAIERLDFAADPQALDKRDELRAMDIAADALMVYAQRHAEELERRAAAASDPDRRRELETMARNCRRVPAHAPKDTSTAR